MNLAYISWRVDIHREIFGIPYFPHGVLIAVGFVAGSWLMSRYTRPRGLPNEVLWDVLTWVLAGSLIGTRLVWVMGHWSELSSPAEIVMIWHGGMSLYGGILGGLVAGIPRVRKYRLPVLSMVDFAAPGLAVGLIFGRASDLITGDHLGKATDFPWGFRYVGGNPPGVAPAVGEVVHPVALYDLLSVAVLLVVLVLFLRKERAPGSAAAVFALWYAAGRLAFDFLRTDPVRAFSMTGTQLASVAVLVFVLTWLLLRARRGNRATRLEHWKSAETVSAPAAATHS
ncbi:MAG: prolipoprotein diacylglyceryl transferase [Actinomycetota bacterium]